MKLACLDTRALVLSLCGALVSAAAGCGPSSGAPAPGELFAKARTAHGGKDALLKLRVAKLAYTMHGALPGTTASKDMRLTVHETWSLPERVHKVIEGSLGGDRSRIEWAIRPGGYWYRENDQPIRFKEKVSDVSNVFRPFQALEELAQYDRFLTQAVDNPLDQKDGCWAARLKSADAPHGAIYYFDKETGCLKGLKVVRHNAATGKDAIMETTFDKFEKKLGLVLYHEINSYMDKEPTAALRVTEIELFDAIEDAAFEPPPR